MVASGTATDRMGHSGFRAFYYALALGVPLVRVVDKMLNGSGVKIFTGMLAMSVDAESNSAW